jgi:sugar O-acyltransferase (sialic acid O-acetyltransferase NeuD family)
MATRHAELIIVGASGHGRVVLDCARCAGFRPIGFIDRAIEPGQSINGVPVLGREPEECAELRARETAWFIAVGDNRAREDLARRVAALTGRPAASVVHPQCTISATAAFGSGVFIGPGVILSTEVRVGHGVILNTACTVDHDGLIKDFAQISPGCHLAGNVTIGTRAFLGTGVAVIPGIAIGDDAVVGAGAVVVEAIAPGVTAVGNPARVRA